MTLVRRVLKAAAAALAFAVYVWFEAVRLAPSVKRRKAARRARREVVNRILMCRMRGAGEPGLSCASSSQPSSRAPSLGAVAPAAGASSGVRFGIQDDAWLVHGPGTLDERLDRLEQLGTDLVRFNLHWDQIEPVRGEPAWEDSDAVLEGLRARGIPAVVGLVGVAALGERRAGRRTSRPAGRRSPRSRARPPRATGG